MASETLDIPVLIPRAVLARVSSTTSMSFSAPSHGAGYFLLRRQEKVAKEKATPAPRFSTFLGRKVRSTRTGLAHAPSMARGPSERNPLRSPCGPDRSRLTAAQGPHLRASCALWPQRRLLDLASNEARMAVTGQSFSERLCTAPRRAADRASKARMVEAMDGRVRAGARSASTEGSRADTMSARPPCQAQWFWPLLPKQKWLARAASETAFWEGRGKRHGCHPLWLRDVALAVKWLARYASETAFGEGRGKRQGCRLHTGEGMSW